MLGLVGVVEDCILLDERRFTLRLYLVARPDGFFLAQQGLVYRALNDSKVSNCSRAALELKGAANAFGAREAPDLLWLRRRLEELPEGSGGGPGSYDRLWRRLQRLAELLGHSLRSVPSFPPLVSSKLFSVL